MSKRVVLTMTDHEAGEISLALQGLQMDVGENGAALRAHRLGLLLERLDQARAMAARA